MNELEDWEFRMMELEEKLHPIAKRLVDFTRPGWFERLQTGAPPLDEAGVRDAAEKLLAEMIAAYAQGTDQMRAAIRRLFQDYPSLSWAATLSVPWTTIEGLRQHLILFSMNDQGRDSRDALLTLQQICQDARNAGLEIAPVLREIAAMSSDANKYGMGSTSQMLLRHC
jgi:hypothetical protein